MEKYLQATETSGVGPVNNKNNNINNIQKPKQNSVSSAERQRKSVSEENQGDHQWNKYKKCVLSQSMIDNFEKFKRSDVPARLMEWRGGTWVELPEDALSQARSAFAKRLPMVEIQVGGNFSIFDFYRMLKGEVESSGLQRSIAWIDVKGNCFFPNFFVDESFVDDDDEEEQSDEHSSNGKNPNVIEIEINVDTCNNINDINVKNKNKKNNEIVDNFGKRKMEGKLVLCDEEDTADSSCKSETGDGNRKRQRIHNVGWPNVRLMSERERLFFILKNLFLNGMELVDPGVQVTAIRQFVHTGPIEQARWEAFQKQMEITAAAPGRGGVPNIAYAWYGTSKRGVFDVLADGFGVSTKVFGSQAHGVGVYLSPAKVPHVSDAFAQADENGEKHLVLCKVILGNVEKVSAGSQQLYPSSDNFDSAVDDPVKPKLLVVWTTNMNTHIIPEFVLSYKCSDCRRGTKVEDVGMQWIPDGIGSGKIPLRLFFLRLKNLLPSDKFEQLKALCLTFKAGKMAKDLFINQIRSVVDTEMMQSALVAIQGSG